MNDKNTKKFKLDNEEIVCKEGEVVFLGHSRYRDDQKSDYKRISDPFQKLLFTNLALDNYLSYIWKIEGSNIPILPHQVFYATKHIYEHSNPSKILDLVTNHWEEDWYVSYHIKDTLKYLCPDVKIYLDILSESEKEKRVSDKKETLGRLPYFQKELYQQEDRPLFVGKHISDGSIVEGFCVLDEYGDGHLDMNSNTWYHFYECIDRYTIIPAGLEGTKRVRFNPGVYRVKCRLVDNAKHIKTRDFFYHRYYLKILEAHLVKKLQDGKLRHSKFTIVEDYRFDFRSELNIFINKIQLIQKNLTGSVFGFIAGLIFIIVSLLVILGALGGIVAIWDFTKEIM